jgi:transglutaminase-like putative cysteine protease
MRINIAHETLYRYDRPARAVVQTLRLSPRNHDGQYVTRWRIEASVDSRLDQHEDAFGNIIHVFTADGPFNELKITVEGEVDTQETNGVVRGAIERFPPSMYLRETALTAPDQAIVGFARDVWRTAGADTLAILHLITQRLNTEFVYDTNPTQTTTTAAEALKLRRGVCQDLAHIFIAAARSLEIPARYIGGHFRRNDGVITQEAGHAWAEAFVPELGWVAFDPTNGICATEAHVRVAVGLDYLGAAPVRGSRSGGGTETLSVAVHIEQAGRQSQG